MAPPPPVLVVGAGHNGLLCAIRLADAGLDVTVLEQGREPGGAVSSGEDTLPGFVHDRCSAFFPLTLASPAFEGLGLERHGLRWIVPAVPMAHPFADGSAIALHRDVEATTASLDHAAPGAGDAWRALVTPLLANGDLVARTALRPFPPVVPGALLAARLGRPALDLARLMLGSSANLGRELFGHPAPAAWLCGSAAHSDLSPGTAGGAAFALGLHWLGHRVGWPLPEGGAGRLAAALVGRLEAAGGRVRCGARVERIRSRDGRVAGVQLAGGERLDAGIVVATVSAGPLARMLDEGTLPARLLRRLRGWRYGLGTFKVDWALSGPVPWSAPEAREAAVVHVGDTVEAFFASAHAAGRGAVPETPAMIVGQQSLHDPARAPAGRHTLYAYARLSLADAVDREAVAELMERRIETFAPGFRSLVLARVHRAPEQLERENPSLVGGDLGGGSYELDQQLAFRPAPELVRHRTPLRGLYLASASVHPGGGVHGVPGAGAARAVLADRSLRGRLRVRRPRRAARPRPGPPGGPA
jgi:phytoene dehydrogenase-like protein